MTVLNTNTFASLSFDHHTQFDFESLVAEFQQALESGVSAPARMKRTGEQLASFDIGPARISLAYSNETFDRDSYSNQKASLAVFVGTAADALQPLTQDDRAAICKGVLDRVEAVHPCDHRVWGETDRDISGIALEDGQTDDAPISTIAPKRVRKLDTASRSLRPYNVDVGDAFDEMQIMAPALVPEVIRPTHPARHADRVGGSAARALPRMVAIGANQTTARDQMIVRNAFRADADEDDIQAIDRPVAHRVAIYTLNTSLVVICLPVGAAMFSYCALGRENLNAVGRAMALTGIALGLARNFDLGGLLPMIG